MSSSGWAKPYRNGKRYRFGMDYAQEGGRAGAVIVGFCRFRYEITLLTIQHADGGASVSRLVTVRKVATIRKLAAPTYV